MHLPQEGKCPHWSNGTFPRGKNIKANGNLDFLEEKINKMDSVQVQIQGPEKLLSFGTELKLSKIYHANVSAHLPQTGL